MTLLDVTAVLTDVRNHILTVLSSIYLTIVAHFQFTFNVPPRLCIHPPIYLAYLWLPRLHDFFNSSSVHTISYFVSVFIQSTFLYSDESFHVSGTSLVDAPDDDVVNL